MLLCVNRTPKHILKEHLCTKVTLNLHIEYKGILITVKINNRCSLTPRGGSSFAIPFDVNVHVHFLSYKTTGGNTFAVINVIIIIPVIVVVFLLIYKIEQKRNVALKAFCLLNQNQWQMSCYYWCKFIFLQCMY